STRNEELALPAPPDPTPAQVFDGPSRDHQSKTGVLLPDRPRNPWPLIAGALAVISVGALAVGRWELIGGKPAKGPAAASMAPAPAPSPAPRELPAPPPPPKTAGPEDAVPTPPALPPESRAAAANPLQPSVPEPREAAGTPPVQFTFHVVPRN